MGKFDKVKKIWNAVKREWKTRYRLVFSNEDTHEQEFVIRRITIQRMFVVAVIAAFVIILLTTLLIAFTPNQKILSVTLLENRETPSYLNRINEAGLLKSWNGLKAKKARKKKVDTVSGATYSSRSIIQTLQAALKSL